jgi:hypothetical protein
MLKIFSVSEWPLLSKLECLSDNQQVTEPTGGHLYRSVYLCHWNEGYKNGVKAMAFSMDAEKALELTATTTAPRHSA